MSDPYDSPERRLIAATRRVPLCILGGMLILGGGAACSNPDAIDADALFVNGHVVTVNDAFDVTEAFAVREGRFVAVGTTAELTAQVDAGRTVDLDGATVLPGFNDNHIHLSGSRTLARWQTGMIPGVAEWTAGARTPAQLQEALAERVSVTPAGEWIQGGLNRPDWPNAIVPTRWELDEIAPDHPVLLTRGPHTYLLNSRALELAGINRNTPDPDGGWIFKDARGEPNGRVLEAARRIVDAVRPEPERVSQEKGLQNMRTALGELATLGITSVNISGIRPPGLPAIRQLYARWSEELPRATLQVRLSPGHDTYDDFAEGISNSIAELDELGFVTGYGDDRLKIGAIKMSIDGGLSAPVFWALEDYPGRPGFRGAIRIPADVFYPVAKYAHDLGWQLGIHTMGDGAVQMVVDGMARILEESPRADHRHYLHHVAVKPPEETIAKMASNSIMVASQPAFTVGLGGFAQEALSPAREQTQNPTKSLQDAGIIVSHGSDSAPYGPLLTIWTAVTRRGWEGQVYGPEEAVTVEEAIRLHTTAPAYFTRDEGMKGSIAVGQLADWVVLGDDILAVDPEAIRDIPVLETWVGARRIHPTPNPTEIP